jgi:hypothetical protein
MSGKTTWRAVRPYMPDRAIDLAALAYRECMRLRCWYQGMRERPLLRSLDIAPVP